jgi:hypothetical protein
MSVATIPTPTPGPQHGPQTYNCELCQTFGLERPAFAMIDNRMPLCAWHYRQWVRAVD